MHFVADQSEISSYSSVLPPLVSIREIKKKIGVAAMKKYVSFAPGGGRLVAEPKGLYLPMAKRVQCSITASKSINGVRKSYLATTAT